MKIFSQRFFSVLFFTATLFFPFASYANSSYEITIVNHFSKPLNFILRINPDVLSDLPQNFTLTPNDQTKTKVLDLQKEAYVSAEDDSGDKAFWGIDIINNAIQFHGYIDKNIAFSWTDDTITFCTPQEYTLKKSC